MFSSIILFILYLFQIVDADKSAASTVHFNIEEVTFAINLPINSTDLYFSFSAPAQSWVGVGVGATMRGSLMFIMYPSANGADVTLSPRIGTGNTEPAYAPEIDIELQDGTTVFNNTLLVYALCRNCRSWHGGSIDLKSTVQDWIYALGPASGNLKSDSPSVGLRRHDEYGHFTLDMVQATGAGGVPNITGVTTNNGAELSGQVKADMDKASITHGIAMVIVFLIMFPFNMIIIELFKWRLFGIWLSIPFQFLMLTGFSLGVYASMEYIRSKKFSSPHQVLGFIIVFGFIFDGALGIFLNLQHRKVKKLGDPFRQRGLESVQIWSQRIFWILAVIDGGIGLRFSSSGLVTKIGYAAIVVFVFSVMMPFLYCIWRKEKKRKGPDHRSEESDDIALADRFGSHG